MLLSQRTEWLFANRENHTPARANPTRNLPDSGDRCGESHPTERTLSRIVAGITPTRSAEFLSLSSSHVCSGQRRQQHTETGSVVQPPVCKRSHLIAYERRVRSSHNIRKFHRLCPLSSRGLLYRQPLHAAGKPTHALRHLIHAAPTCSLHDVPCRVLDCDRYHHCMCARRSPCHHAVTCAGGNRWLCVCGIVGSVSLR